MTGLTVVTGALLENLTSPGRLKPTITQTNLIPNHPGVLVIRGGEILQERRSPVDPIASRRAHFLHQDPTPSKMLSILYKIGLYA